MALFLIASPLSQPLRNAVFDGYQRVFPLQRDGTHVMVVQIDENSIVRYGQWPWPRTRMAELIEAIARQKPLAIGLDLFFPERDRYSPDVFAAEVQGLPAAAAQALGRLPSNDARFAEAIRGKPVVLGVSAETQPDPRFPDPPRAATVRVGPHVLDEMRVRSGHIGNLAMLDAAAAGRGAMNSGPQDQVVRVVPLVFNVQGTVVPSLGVESLRVAADAHLELDRIGAGLLRLRFDQVDVKLQDTGETWLRYARDDAVAGFPAAGVMAGDVAPDTFTDKIVLIGMSGLGVQDFKTTPLGEFVPGVHIHAQVIENLLANISLVRPAWAPWLEALLLLACGGALVAFVPRLSALRGINLALALVIALFAAGALAFRFAGVLIDPLWPAIGTAAVFGSVVVGTLSEADRQRRVLREEAAHMAGEVDAARRIQMGLLPDPREAVGTQTRFALAAMLEPARTVGGDFYDCFVVDQRLFLVVADVSGKGLPAALFMAAAKSHLKSAALRGGSLGEVFARAQAEIMRENPEQLFVTAFAASLDLDSGLLEYANAGHEPPFSRKPHGAPARIAGAGGPPLCVVDDFPYASDRRQLEPGEWFVVVTDGATEAMNPKREFFGVERLNTVLSWLPMEARPAQIIDRIRSELARFCDGAEAADDVTILVLRWEG